MQKKKNRNCSLSNYGTVLSDWWAHRIWSGPTASIFWWPLQVDLECAIKTFITMHETTQCPNPDHIINPHHCGHLRSSTKKYSEQLKHFIHGNVTLGKPNYRRAVCFFNGHSTYHILYPLTVHKVFHTFSHELRKPTIISTITHLMVRATYDKFKSSTKIIPQGNLTCWKRKLEDINQ